MRQALLLPLAQLWTSRDLLRELVMRELKVRYRRSVLGFGWSLLTPIYQIVIYTLILKYVMHVDINNLSVNILCAIIPWTYFSVAVTNSCSAVLRYRNVVKKVYFPRHMLPLATVGANLVHLVLSTLVLFAVFLAIPVAFNPIFYFIIPLVVCQTLLVAGLSFICACAHTYYQDVEYVLTNLMQVGMFVTPVLYPVANLKLIDPVYRTIFMLNPMAAYTEGWRGILLRHEYPDPLFFGIAVGVSVAVFLLGLALWQKYEWRFPEVL
jgi:lipopolysaccharide transport system permease protein